ncbi:uncharacterized protein LOC124541695 [Vanessa cardui]|uniref:uncharacterized protein LOC124541695 n=1 Tax=Vanessa cardui TaxID=171605 RepID=UPI001F13D14E|nr:uncharacterized protein LOC124541695 [Vanessa cardui]XP_046975581.1 uncharacterized protein LOC124541695 [Vanessa cardui]XP_046975582.1 uncharacterized protein LOC124541695 [Vanessa cardui]
MSDYESKLRKIDETSLLKLREGKGPVDQCLCPLFSSPDKTGLAQSVKKAFKSIGTRITRNKSKNVPIHIDNGGFSSTKEVVKRVRSCRKCGCDSENFVLKHSFANIRITSPDISTICPCPSDCLPDKTKLRDNIRVIIEHANVTNSYNGMELVNENSENN